MGQRKKSESPTGIKPMTFRKAVGLSHQLSLCYSWRVTIIFADTFNWNTSPHNRVLTYSVHLPLPMLILEFCDPIWKNKRANITHLSQQMCLRMKVMWHASCILVGSSVLCMYSYGGGNDHLTDLEFGARCCLEEQKSFYFPSSPSGLVAWWNLEYYYSPLDGILDTSPSQGYLQHFVRSGGGGGGRGVQFRKQHRG